MKPFDWIVNVELEIPEPRDERGLTELIEKSAYQASLGYIDHDYEYEEPRSDVLVSMLVNGPSRLNAGKIAVEDLLSCFPSETKIACVTVMENPELGLEVGYA